MLAISWLSVKSAEPTMTCEPEDPLLFPPPDSGLPPPPPHADSARTEVTARADSSVRFFMVILLM